jgi:hypothetical protein
MRYLLILILFASAANASPIRPRGVILNYQDWVEYQQDLHAEVFQVALSQSLREVIGISRQRSCLVSRAIIKSMHQFGAEPFLIAGLIIVESRGNPSAVSPVGALGLMQIMPGTGRDIAREFGNPWSASEMLTNLDLNVRYGTWYYYQLHQKFQGDYERALAAYNWGPAHIASRIRRQKRLPRVYPERVLIAEEEVRLVFGKRYRSIRRGRRDQSIDFSNHAPRTRSYSCGR